MNKPKNDNYAATVVEIKTILPIENCDNVVYAIIMGNRVIVSKDVKEGDTGLFFPVETQLSEKYLRYNNLYRKSELNIDPTQKGYFEENGRIRCVKFRGNPSEGLFMPLMSLSFTTTNIVDLDLEIGNCFDELNGIEICRKYVIKKHNTPGLPGSKGNKKKKFESKLVDNQFRFHEGTSMLYKNLHHIHQDDLISITYKLHGTSGISSKILCKKKLKWYEQILLFLGVNINTTRYDNIYASRTVIKNEDLNPDAQHFYNVDIWGIANEVLKDYLQDGMTFYYEIVGYLPNGSLIQKEYDYGCLNPILDTVSHYKHDINYKIFIYRITYTNPSGKVFEFSAKQVQDFCKQNGLNAVPELFYGYVKDFDEFFTLIFDNKSYGGNELLCKVKKDFNPEEFLNRIKLLYNEHNCFMCKNQVPEEGCVIRIEDLNLKVFKQKSTRFLEKETKNLDKGEIDLESEN